MEQRKLIRLGNSSFAIALPKQWVDKAGLKKGDDVFVTPNSNGELIVQPFYKKANGEKRIEIKTEGKDSSTLRREIASHYVNGYNLLSIKGKRTRETTELIKNSIKSLLGFEIIKNDGEEIIAKDLFNLEEIDINNFIRRIDNNIHEMFDILADGLNKKKVTQSQFSDLEEADRDINKFHRLISRIFSMGVDNPSILTQLKVGSIFLINSWWFSFNLEHIGDELKSVVKIIRNESLTEKDFEMFTKSILKLRNIYNDSMEFFYNREFGEENALKIVADGEKLWEEFNKLTLNKNSTIAKIAMKLKEIETSVYQNIKMVLNTRN